MMHSLNGIFVLFLIYAAIGVSVEVIYTGIKDPLVAWWKGEPVDKTFPCRVNLWSIPVYAVSATISYSFLKAYAPGFFLWPWFARGVIYALGIYAWEFAWGLVLDLFGIQSWKYKNSPYRIWRYINPSHCYLWFGLGFLLEAILITILPRMLA